MSVVATVVSPKTVAMVDANYLQTLLGYNARRVSLQVIELFNERMAVYDLSPVDFSVLSLVHHNPGTRRASCAAPSACCRPTWSAKSA